MKGIGEEEEELKFLFSITAIFCIYIYGAAFSAVADAEENSTLIASYEPDLPPFHFEEEGELQGFAIDILKEIASRESVNIEFRPMTETEAAAALAAEEIDIIIGMNYSEIQAETMEFSNPYYSTSIGLFVPNAREEIDSIIELSDRTIAVKANSLERDFLQNIRRIQFNESSTLKQAVELTVLERADAIAGEISAVEQLLEDRGERENFYAADSYILPMEYSFAVSNEDYQTLRLLNNGLRTLQNDGGYQELFQEWFPEESGQRENLLLALQILGLAFLITAAVIIIGVRLNRRLQKEVARKTESLNEVNLSLKEQVEATKNSNEFQKQILQSSPRGMMTINEEGIITSYSSKAAFILNDEENKVGKNYQEEKLLQYFLKEKLEDVLIYEKQFLGEEGEWEREDGIHLRLRAYIYPLYNFEQHVIGVMFTFEDISEEVQIRYKAFENEKNQALSRVVAGIAHEIRNPLTSIKTFIELIPQKFDSPRFRERIAELVPQEIERLNELIEGLMDYSKSSPAKQEELDTSTLLETTHILFQRTAENKGVEIKTYIENDLFILADRQQLKQAVINLIINAVDALQESEGEKWVSLKNYKNAGYVYIEIQDNGPGMSPGVQKQAFEPFYTTKAHGTGLGLAIAKQHVEENKGHFSVESSIGKGTLIQLSFPQYAIQNKQLREG